MIKLKIVILLSITIISCSSKSKEIYLKFNSETYNYGFVKYDSNFERNINFKVLESGTKIINAYADCGCTTLSYPKNSFEKNAKGTIKFKYDTKLVGEFVKRIFIYTNKSKKPIVLFIEGEIKK